MYTRLITALLVGSTLAHPVLEARSKNFQFYDLLTPAAGPCDLTQGPDGALWGEAILVNKIFRVAPQDGKVTEYTIPFTTPVSNQTIPGVGQKIQDRIAFSCAIRQGADGNLYAGNGINNQLVRINPTTKQIKVFTPGPLNPLGNGFPFNDLYTDANGIWSTQTTGNVFTYFEFATEEFTTYNVPTPLALPLGVFVASNGKVYIPELNANQILVYDPQAKTMDEYVLPELVQFPAVVRAEHEGWVYFTLFIGNGLGRINMVTNEIQLFHTSQLLNLGSEDTIDNDGNVWESSFDIDALSKFDTSTLKFSYVDFPKSFASGNNGVVGDIPPYVDVAVNYGPGNNIWFVSLLKNQVGRYSLS